MRFLIVLSVLALAGCSPREVNKRTWSEVYRDNEWIVTEVVAFAASRDPSDIELGDGRRVSIFYGGKSDWETASAWTIGTELTLAYSKAQGFVLIEPESGFRAPVYDGFDDRHPLDLLLNQNLAVDFTTVGSTVAYDASIVRWNEEIERLHDYFQNSTLLSKEAKAALAVEQRAWAEFLSAHSVASSELFGLPEGTMWRSRSVEYLHQITRDHAVRLLKLISALSAADIQKWDF